MILASFIVILKIFLSYLLLIYLFLYSIVLCYVLEIIFVIYHIKICIFNRDIFFVLLYIIILINTFKTVRHVLLSHIASSYRKVTTIENIILPPRVASVYKLINIKRLL